MRKTATILAAGLIVASFAPANAQDADANTVVASVDGVDITLGQMIITRSQLPQQYQQLSDDILWEGILDQLVQQQLLAAQMPDLPNRVRMALENEQRSLLAGEVITDLTDAAVTEEALQAAYEARFASAGAETEFNASHILVETEEEALAVIERLNNGADFADTAREISTGPSGPSGGELGWFGIGMMVPEFEVAVTELGVAEISRPVQTQFGWHVIRLNDSRLKETPTLDDVRDELIAQVQQEAITNALDSLAAAADIQRPEEGAFDPALLQNVELLDR